MSGVPVPDDVGSHEGDRTPHVHPYIPNSAPETKRAMLDAIGVHDVEELYASIPAELRVEGLLDLPPPVRSEVELRRHVTGFLERNTTCGEFLSFLGGGCWQHSVPAVCDEIARRGEFLTYYAGNGYANLGAFQAQFEYQSLVGELVGMEVVGAPSYDWGTAAASSLLMAARITGRRHVVVPATMGPRRLSQIRAACGGVMTVEVVGYDRRTGALDRQGLRAAVSSRTAAVYVEVPSYLGLLEPEVDAVGRLAHEAGALYVVGVDPSSLGVLSAPRDYGADIVCGELQPLGLHMHYGGGLAGFIATPHQEPFLETYPSLLVSILPTTRSGEYGFDWVNWETTHYVLRESSEDFTGTTQTLWGIVAGAYLALMGPDGMRELGEGILRRSGYAIDALSGLPGVVGSVLEGAAFKEFVVGFDGTGRTVAEVNAGLRQRRIFGGADLSGDFPELGQSALYSVTEVHDRADIDRLVEALSEVLG